MKPNRTLIVLSIGAALTTVSTMSLAWSKGADRTLVGAWRTAITLVDCQTGQPVGVPPIRGLQTFNLGGTLSEYGIGPGSTPALRSPGTGVWERDHGWRDHSVTFVYYRYDPSGAFIGSQRVVSDLRLAASRDGFESISVVEILDVSDNVVATRCAAVVGTRVE